MRNPEHNVATFSKWMTLHLFWRPLVVNISFIVEHGAPECIMRETQDLFDLLPRPLQQV